MRARRAAGLDEDGSAEVVDCSTAAEGETTAARASLAAGAREAGAWLAGSGSLLILMVLLTLL